MIKLGSLTELVRLDQVQGLLNRLDRREHRAGLEITTKGEGFNNPNHAAQRYS